MTAPRSLADTPDVPLVSIVTPVWSGARFLPHALASVRAQDQDAEMAVDIMGEGNPVRYEDRMTQYRAAGFTGYDASAPPYGEDEMQAERARYAEEGSQRLGLDFIPSYGNFLTIKVGKAAEIYKRLLRRGVIVRPVGGGYELPEHLRVTIGTPQENERFLAALSASLRD